jgi:hypothetical protein
MQTKSASVALPLSLWRGGRGERLNCNFKIIRMIFCDFVLITLIKKKSS